MRSTIPLRATLAAFGVAAAACSDNPTQPAPKQKSAGALVVSQPVTSSGLSPSGLMPSGPGGGTVVFLSVAPGTAPQGSSATLVNVSTGLQVTAAVRGGGVDPVPVPASVGDSIAVTIPVSSGSDVVLGDDVPASSPPTVVRTFPADGATSVPRNRSLIVVFSEPVSSATVAPSSFRLTRGGTAVSGTVAFLDSSHVAVVFTPSGLLDAGASYRFLVGITVTDLDGEHLDDTTGVDFTAGSSLLGPVASVAVYPLGITIPADRLVQFSALLTDAAGDTLFGPSLTWATSNTAVAALAGEGVGQGVMVRGVAAGSATITATSGGVPGSGTLDVIGALPTLALATLTAGYDHTCARTTGGSAYCWGANGHGQLGTGGTGSTPYLAAVSGGLTFSTIGAGLFRNCALTSAGAAWCWGDTSLTNIISPTDWTPTPRAVPGTNVFASLAVGGNHACGLTAGGQAWCWGVDSWGQLGDGSFGGTSTPRSVAGGHTFVALSAGSAHTCGLAADSTAWCWGYNAYGALGNGATSALNTPVAVQGGLLFVTIAAGYGHSCAITAAGALYCWGANGRGQLGATSAQTCPGQADAVATDACSLSPIRVTGTAVFRSVGAGYTHSCALTSGGAAYCWGENTYAQLGNGAAADSPTPVTVAGSLTFAKLSSANYHSCGVATTGVAYCWGQGVHGELGDGGSTDRRTPVRVAGQ